MLTLPSVFLVFVPVWHHFMRYCCQGAKKPPAPLSLDPKDPLHLEFITAVPPHATTASIPFSPFIFDYSIFYILICHILAAVLYSPSFFLHSFPYIYLRDVDICRCHLYSIIIFMVICSTSFNSWLIAFVHSDCVTEGTDVRTLLLWPRLGSC